MGLEELFNNEQLDMNRFEEKIVESTPKDEIIEVNLSELRGNPDQPRKVFDEEKLKELANSIKEHGVFQPIIVKKSIKGYELIAGERRTRASKMAGKTTIPAIIREMTDQEMMEIALVENIQRENLNPIEEATAFEKIIQVNNLTQEETAKRFGKSRSYITNLLGLLTLPEKTKKYVQEGKISMGHARVLSKLSEEDQINKLANKIIEDGLSVREVENLTSGIDMPKKKKIKREPVYNAKHSIYEGIMRDKIGTKVKISTKKIEIPFDSDSDLDRILEIIGISLDGE
jgi:ParB family chromosome partitioning protein